MLERAHVQRIRQEMPAVTSQLYLNTGTFGPLPGCVLSAMDERLQKEYLEGRIGSAMFSGMAAIYTDARSRLARLLHADTDEIALTDNTGEGMNIISFGFNWHEGDEVITTNHEHISALAPLYQLRERYGIVLRFADLGTVADVPAREAIEALVTPRTRLIVLSHVVWTTGAQLHIRDVGDLGRERDIPVLVDGAQSAGAIPVDVKALNVDFYAVPMQKWLCGPDGTGGLYVRRESLRYIFSTYVGYWSMRHEEDIEWALHEHAQRFELGGRQTAGVAGQAAVLKWFEEELGYAHIYERIAALHTYAYSTLKAVAGLHMLTPQPGVSGLLSFQLEGRDGEEVVKGLREQHNIVVRTIPSLKALRVSTGFYNTEEEIDTLAKALHHL